MKNYVAITQELREADITATMYVGIKKFGKQLDYAVKEHFSHVVILGASELEANAIKIKDLETREEVQVERDKLLAFFGK